MTYDELFNQGVRKIRLPDWNEWAYLELQETDSGGIRPFCKLWDIFCPGKELGLWQVDRIDYEPWTPPADFDERQAEIYSPRTPSE